MPRLYVYSRVSTLRQITGHGLTGQDEARERWLADNQKKFDLELVEDYRDLGISGRGKNVTEGKMGLILDGVESGKIPTGSWLAVDSLDRISRDELIEAHYLVSGIIRAGIIIVTIADGMIFDRSEKEKMMFNLLISLVTLARSSNESEAKSFRGLRNWVAKRAEAETGKPMTAMTPAWIDLDDSGCLVLNQHAETVRAIFEFAGEGFGTSLIVQKLNAEGRTSLAVDRRKDGGKWSRRYITLILANRSVLGEFRPGRKNQGLGDKRVPTGTVIPNYFPPAITPALWLKAQASLADRKPLDIRPRRSNFSNLFAGLCRCVACGEAMTICHRPKPSNLSYLRCPGRFNTKTCTEGRAYSYHALEKAVFDLLPVILFDPPEPSDGQAIALTEKADCLKIAIERTSTARKSNCSTPHLDAVSQGNPPAQ
jgi:DNA invertase Pin-like site-specific DNA recombinase